MSNSLIEFKVSAPALAPIQANLQELKNEIAAFVDKYKNAFYTDEDMKAAKADRADLRRLREDIDAKRKAVKAKWNEPYAAFESEVKEITGLIDEPIGMIDTQIKDWEERRRKARRELLEGVFDEWNQFGELILLERVLDAEMMKMSVTDNKAKVLLLHKLERITGEIAQLESIIGAEFRTDCLSEYLQSFDLAKAVMKEKIMAKEKEKQEAVLGAVIKEEQTPSAQPVQQEETVFEQDPTVPVRERVESRRFVITASAAQINELKRFCYANNIKIREVF